MRQILTVIVLVCLLVGCNPESSRTISPRVGSLDASVWSASDWLSAKNALVYEGEVAGGATRAAEGTSWFVAVLTNANAVVSAKWMTAGLGVYEVYVNGKPVGDDFLKPGFTHNAKTKYAFTYDVTRLLKGGAGDVNVFAAEVSSGWWRDKVCSPTRKTGGFFGRKSAFRGVLELGFADATSPSSNRTCGFPASGFPRRIAFGRTWLAPKARMPLAPS